MVGVMMECGHAANGKTDGDKPACVICVGIDEGATVVATAKPDLTGRKARCYCGTTEDSSPALAFFEFRGEGSRVAREKCGNCAYSVIAHGPEATRFGSDDLTAVERAGCPGFEPHGAMEFDLYYDGCRGWE